MAGSQHHITVNTTFVEFMGELEGGVFLSQLIYWSDRGGRKDGWFYKTQKEWEQEIGIKRRAITRCTKELESRGIVQTKVMKVGGAPTTHYRLNMDELTQQLGEFLEKNHEEAMGNKELYERTNGNVRMNQTEMHERTNGNVQAYKTSITENTPIDYTKDYDTASFNVGKNLESNTRESVSSDQHFAEILKALESILPPMQQKQLYGGILGEEVGQDYEEYGYELQKEAIRKAALAGKSHYGYVHGILRNWKNEGVRTIADVHAKYAQKQSSQRSHGGQGMHRTVEDIMNDPTLIKVEKQVLIQELKERGEA